MLARVNRVVRADDYRRTVRRGRKIGTAHIVSHILRRGDDGPTRFGFIVAKSVGNAVCRNRVRRRLKAAVFELLDWFPQGADVVVRALPASASASWTTLRNDVCHSVERVEVNK